MIEQNLREFCGTTNPLILKLRGGGVLRYHAEGELIRQSVAEHSWRAAVICAHLWPNASAKLLMAIMHHDVAEIYVGDTPAPVKREVKQAFTDIVNQVESFLGILPIDPEDYLKVKVCDYLEGYLTCVERDNLRAHQISQIFSQYVRELAIDLPSEDRVRVYAILGKHE